MNSLLKSMDFGNEAADDADPEELATYFVEHPIFNKFLNEQNRILLATAKKGSGKSALLQWIAYNTAKKHPDALIIKCRGADLVRNKFNLQYTLVTPNDYIHDWMIRVCALVNRHLALKLNIALTDDTITLVETAELEGYKSRNLVSCLFDRMVNILGKGQPKKLPATNETELLKRVKNGKVWIIIDDLDATYQNTKQESIEIGTFFSACRYITKDMDGILIRATMRTDVWALIRRYDESLDKMEQYVSDILWYQDDFLRLLYLRIHYHLNKKAYGTYKKPTYISDAAERLIERVFVNKMEWADKLVDTYKVIYTMSYERPRWAIQLCKLAQQSAIRHHRDLITKQDIENVWGEYGAKRIADLVAEHKHQCNQIEELLNGFRGCERLMSRDKLFSWINNRICNHLVPVIEGEHVRSPQEIARFLYRLGFIMARSDSISNDHIEGYEHYRFDQMPDFLSSRTDDDFGLIAFSN